MAITETMQAAQAPTAEDPRNYNFDGLWQRSLPARDTETARDDLDEPHRKRKLAMLKKYPEITSLYGIDTRTKWIALAGVSTQLACAFLFGRVWTETWLGMFLTAYVVGGTLTGVFGVVVHEATHGLTAESPLANRAIGLLANFGIIVPIFSSFRRYHLEHHAYQGVIGHDPDMPMDWEIRLIRGNTALKVLWVLIFPLMYIVRGAAMGRAMSRWEKVNWATSLASNAAVWYLCGPRALVYMLLSLWLGYSMHPVAVHFIQEHYTWEDGQETYSYYGKGNTIMMNIGYHNEHHDFTKIPWSNLPKLKAMAPEFYDTMYAHTSWIGCMRDFLFSAELGPQSRVERTLADHNDARRMRLRDDAHKK